MKRDNNWGKIQVYTGDGKGKTTASLGLAIRALGRGKRVAIIYFDKGGNNYGERKVLDKFKGSPRVRSGAASEIEYFVFGRDRIDPVTGTFEFGVKEIDQQECQKALMLAAKFLVEQTYDLLILDEVNSCLGLDMFLLKDLLEIIDKKTEQTELVLTGRNAHPEIIARADLVTEMKMIKHYFMTGTNAREGIEY